VRVQIQRATFASDSRLFFSPERARPMSKIRRGGFCHPDKASNASGRKDLGQLRATEAGTGLEIAQRSSADVVAPPADRLPSGPRLRRE
jgi:hypothetical protein